MENKNTTEVIAYPLSAINEIIDALNHVTVTGLENMDKIIGSVSKLRSSAIDINQIIAEKASDVSNTVDTPDIKTNVE